MSGILLLAVNDVGAALPENFLGNEGERNKFCVNG
jgi:hypothetical protein